jgi:phosphohistidine phosphatase
MKQIILFRHGKSPWADGSLSDVSRPLLAEGEKRTIKVAKQLLSFGIKPDMLITSHANRALHTAELVSEVLGSPAGAIKTEPALYHASTDAIWDVIAALPETVRSVILFGHNPGFTEFVNISGISNMNWMPTSGLAGATFPCKSWQECPGVIPCEPIIMTPKNC